MSTTEITIRAPDDFHVHLRDGAMLTTVVPQTSSVFARALVMPNLTPPVITGADSIAYKRRIQRVAKNAPNGFEPLMTIKIVPHTTTTESVLAAKNAGVIAGKLYPKGVTTNSDDGWDNIEVLDPVFRAMEACGMTLCLHGESPSAFCIDREAVFVVAVLPLISRTYPDLKIVLEHVTTKVACEAVDRLPNVAATITAHHLWLTLDDVIGSALRPHNFCKPVAKRSADRNALRDRATGNNPKFFLGTDSAPHRLTMKERDHGCAGCFTAPVALPAVAQAFEDENAMHNLNAFVSERGADWYGLPRNEGMIELRLQEWVVPTVLYPSVVLVPWWGGKTLRWQVS